ncbi:MAG: NUDIX domain-containing protein [Hyphomicrobiales bacterium]
MVSRLRPHRLIGTVLRPWWRLTRGLTMGAQAVILDPRGRVLLIRHGYRPGWFFPGGGVERGETLLQALTREVMEEAGVEINGSPVLHGVFSNHGRFAGDHVALFVVRDWKQLHVPEPSTEIAEQGFFAPGELPRGSDPAVARRLAEILDGKAADELW